MKVSVSWLKEYVPVEMEISALADALTMAGLEVEGVADRYEYLNQVVVGRVTSVESHPNADKLKLCKVDVGESLIDVVCGAPNTVENMLVPCALPGTCFPNGAIIEKGAIRGQVSEGMLCSESELGLGTDSAGIMTLNPDFTVGRSLKQAHGLSDFVIEIDLTPNRPDCLSVIGVAREIAVFHNTTIKYPTIDLPDVIDNIEEISSVTIQDPDLCPRYAAKVLFDIKVVPSPFWLQDRLISVGLKPINNIVDITNFVMMELGQPLHAFDFDRLFENRIVVRRAEKGEVFTTLDQKERTLTSENLMICDGEKPVALAGVMGGLNSEIEKATTNVLIESACFDPVSVRKTSKRLGLSTDASHRFERGVDPDGTVTAADRAAQLMTKIAGGRLVKGTIDSHPKPYQPKTISLSTAYTNRLLGTEVAPDQIKSHLAAIEFEAEQEDSDTLKVSVPSFRVDVVRPEDLIEEVARLSGYNNIKTTFPRIPAEARKSAKALNLRNRIKDLMVGLGFNETINYSFINSMFGDRLMLNPDDSRRDVVEILNPLTEDQSVMRTSLIPGLLETMHRNIARQERNLRIFEIGKVFQGKDKRYQPEEVEMTAGLWTGLRNEAQWQSKDAACDFYDIKGSVEALFHGLNLCRAKFTLMPEAKCSYTRSGYTARIFIEKTCVGLIGEVDPQVLENFDLKQPAFIFEFNLDQMTPHVPEARTVKPLPKFPGVSRDITLIIDKGIETWDVLSRVEDLKAEFVENIYLFDMYTGDPIPGNKKSVSFRIEYRSEEKTLEDDDVNTIHTRISETLVKQFDALLPA